MHKPFFLGIAMCVFAIPLAEASAQTRSALPLAQRVNQAEEQVVKLQGEINELRQQIRKAQLEASFLRFKLDSKQDSYKQIDLDLASREFQRLDADWGSFLVSVQDVTPYLDGFKVMLDIGNPSSAKYSGYKVRLRWGKNYDFSQYTEASYKKWEESIKEKEVPFTDVLLPGVWNKVELMLPSTKPEELGLLQLSLKTEAVSLLKQ